MLKTIRFPSFQSFSTLTEGVPPNFFTASSKRLRTTALGHNLVLWVPESTMRFFLFVPCRHSSLYPKICFDLHINVSSQIQTSNAHKFSLFSCFRRGRTFPRYIGTSLSWLSTGKYISFLRSINIKPVPQKSSTNIRNCLNIW